MNPVRKLPVLGRLLGGKSEPAPEARVYRGIQSLRRRARPLYYALRTLFRAAVRTQHREIEVIGLENIPADGPVLLVGNHPNSYLDYFNVLNVVRHPVATAAKDTLTNLPIVGPLLRHHMLMTPLSRKMDQEETGVSEDVRRDANEKSLREAVETLVHGRILNIFAEGRSTDSRTLNKIKLGFMHIAIQAEKEFDFKLNLRIVPYGFYYDRINKFQSSVAVIFGKPFKLSSLMRLPQSFLAESESDRSQLEKRLMVEGKKRLIADIESIIISIPERSLVDLIDDATSLYVSSPVKYMGPYENILEKYRLSKTLADSMLAANANPAGRAHLQELKKTIAAYRKNLEERRLNDRVVRREHTWAALGFHVKALIGGLLASPLIVFGFLSNYIPRLAGRFRRYYVINIQKRARVDGDEQAIIYAFAAVLITYPAFAWLYHFLLVQFAGEPLFAWLDSWFKHSDAIAWLRSHWSQIAMGLALFSVYLMARLWRFSLRYGQRLRAAWRFALDIVLETFRKGDIERLRDQRYEIIDRLDFVIGDFSS